MAGFAMTLKLAELIVKVDTVICKKPFECPVAGSRQQGTGLCLCPFSGRVISL